VQCNILDGSEVAMSETKSTKAKRAVPSPEAIAEPAPALPAQTLSNVVALPVPPSPPQSRAQDFGADKLFAAYRATLASIGAPQAALASDVTAMALEMSGLARSNLTAAGDSVTALLSARSLVDAVEIQLGFARRSLDAMADGSTRLGEIGLRLASGAAKPILGPFAAS
jgi:hypothetical protein